MEREPKIELNRECEVIRVPSGQRDTLPSGTNVSIVQDLGGTFTVVTEDGYMVRIAAKDADAIGKEVALPESATDANAGLEEQVWEQLRTCFDPEIPINIADLGLIYACDVTPIGPDEHRVAIKMTLTAPGCGMGDVLKAEVETKVEKLPGVKELDVELVFEPPWDFNMIPDAAKLTLGMY